MAITTSAATQPVSADTASARATKSSVSIAKNMDTFLSILTTQLKHQSPLSPMDSNQFTQQLVQFASVEQQINMNQSLAGLMSMMQSQQTNSALGYLGQNVTYDGSQSSSIDNATVKWSFNPPDTGKYTLRITDAGGVMVRETTADFTGGKDEIFNWTSGRSDNAPIGTGVYKLELLRGTGATATPVTVTGSGKVTAIDTAGGQTSLIVSGQKISAAKVTRVAIPE